MMPAPQAPTHPTGLPYLSHGKAYYLDIANDREHSLLVLKALASEWRLSILELLNTNQLSVNQIAKKLNIPLSTATMHVKSLEEAELISTTIQPAVRGQQKICARRFELIEVAFPSFGNTPENAFDVSMPIGAYVGFEVTPTCGLASETALIGMMDDPLSFWEPNRINAQILWFGCGHLDYLFPIRIPPKAQVTGVQLRMEVCSEAPTHSDDWPSDITVWVNDVEIGTWTSPSDFGGSHGALTPAWWLDADTQYGQLKRWEVNCAGTFIDGIQLSPITLAELSLGGTSLVRIRIGVKPTARHVGGLNLFGRRFGNYPEDITLRITYE